MARLLASALTAAVLALSASSAVTAQGLPEKLVIGTEGAYPPFNFTETDGSLAGFEIELGNALCAQIKVTCEWVAQDWDGIIPGLEAKKYDAIIASLYITDERRQVVSFSDKYYAVPSRFVVPTASELDISAEGLAGKIVGTQRATAFERYLTADMPDVDLRLYGTMDEAYLDLIAGRVDAVLGDVVAIEGGFLSSADGAGFELRGPEFIDPEFFGNGAGVAVRKEDQAIADAFSGAIKALREDGTYQKISEKWFGLDVYGG